MTATQLTFIYTSNPWPLAYNRIGEILVISPVRDVKTGYAVDAQTDELNLVALV